MSVKTTGPEPPGKSTGGFQPPISAAGAGG